MEPAHKPPPADQAVVSVIGDDITITGNIEASVDLHIQGRVKGDVRCSTLILGENSVVTGNIYADRVRIGGTVDGKIETKDLAIEETAKVTSDMTYSRLRIATGAVVEGQLKHVPSQEPASDTGRLKLVEPESEPKPAVFIE